MGIGAQKAGTTWLYEHLKRHPEIRFPGGKEQHFWNRAPDADSISAYLQQFDDPHRHEGEITPAYSFMGRDEVARLHQYAPHLRLFIVLRNPIERAWSSALMALRRAELDIDCLLYTSPSPRD